MVVDFKLHGLTLYQISPLPPNKQVSVKSRVSPCYADIYTHARVEQYIQMLMLNLYLVHLGATAPNVLDSR